MNPIADQLRARGDVDSNELVGGLRKFSLLNSAIRRAASANLSSSRQQMWNGQTSRAQLEKTREVGRYRMFGPALNVIKEIRITAALLLILWQLFALTLSVGAEQLDIPGIRLPADFETAVHSTPPAIPPDEAQRYGHGDKTGTFEFEISDPRNADVELHAFAGRFVAVPDTAFGRWLVIRKIAEFKFLKSHPGIERPGFVLDRAQEAVVRSCRVLTNAQIACAGMSNAPYRLMGTTNSILPVDASAYGDPSRPVPAYHRVRLQTFSVSSPVGADLKYKWYPVGSLESED